MKIYVGTLYSGENEFEECVASIQSQSYKNFDHFVFKNLPNKEAHVTLFKSFLERASEYDLLIKVDADTVLSYNTLFEKIVHKLQFNSWLDVLSIAVYDFISGQLIDAGMAVYRNTVRWNFEKETMFVDIPEVDRNRYLYDDSELAPAAIHCKNPLPYHAFHYGVHRGLKSIQRIHSTTHWAFLEKTWKNFQRTRDTRIGLAVLGAELVYAGRFKKSDVDYTNPKVRTVLEEYLSLDSAGLESEIRKMRLFNWGILPGDLRRRVIRTLRNSLVYM
jgi:hypothetical protein